MTDMHETSNPDCGSYCISILLPPPPDMYNMYSNIRSSTTGLLDSLPGMIGMEMGRGMDMEMMIDNSKHTDTRIVYVGQLRKFESLQKEDGGAAFHGSSSLSMPMSQYTVRQRRAVEFFTNHGIIIQR